MKNEDSKPSLLNKNDYFGKKDVELTYISKWPIYKLHIIDKNGLWIKLKTELDILEHQSRLEKLTLNEINDFLKNKLEIAFELYCFEEMLPDFYFFKFKNEIFCYTIGKKGKDTRRIYARFYFDLNKIFNY